MLNWPLLSHDNADQSGADYVSPWDCCVSAVDSYVGLPGSMGYSTWDAVNILLGWTAISFDDDKDKNPGKKNNLSFNRGSTREQKRFLPGSFFFFFFVEGGGGGGGGGLVMDLGQHRDILTLTSQLVDMANLLSGGIRESCVLIGYPSRQDGTILPARDFPLRSRKKNIPFFAV